MSSVVPERVSRPVAPPASAHPSAASAARRRAWQRNLIGYLFIAPWLLAFLAFTAIPMLGSAVLAFTDYNVLSQNLKWVGLDNFQRMLFNDPRYWRSVQATFTFALIAVPLKLMFALALAMLFNTRRRFVYGYRAAYYAPSIVGASVAVAVVWRELVGRNGPVNAVLGQFGVPAQAWLGNPDTALWTVILLSVWEFGSPLLIFLSGLKQIPEQRYEAASIDGAGPWNTFLRMTSRMLTRLSFIILIWQMI